jgi:hypothetical protein
VSRLGLLGQLGLLAVALARLVPKELLAVACGPSAFFLLTLLKKSARDPLGAALYSFRGSFCPGVSFSSLVGVGTSNDGLASALAVCWITTGNFWVSRTITDIIIQVHDITLDILQLDRLINRSFLYLFGDSGIFVNFRLVKNVFRASDVLTLRLSKGLSVVGPG